MEIKPDPVDRILQHALDGLLSGEDSLDSILARYPGYAEELRPVLETALWLATHQTELNPRPGFLSASRRRLLSRIRWQRSPLLATLRRILHWFSDRPALRVSLVTLLLIVIISGSFFSARAQESLPGDAVYPIKIFSENVQVAFTSNPAARVRLQVRLARRRGAEVEALVHEGRFDRARAALHGLNHQAQETVSQLEALRAQDPAQAQELARELSDYLQDEAQVIDLLASSAPASLQEEFSLAAEDSLVGLADMQDTLLGIEASATPTPTVSGTGPGRTSTPTPSDSTVPVQGGAPETVGAGATTTPTPPSTPTPRPSDTHPPIDLVENTWTPTLRPGNTRRPTITPKPTHTPRPTNIHRPQKPTARLTKTPKP